MSGWGLITSTVMRLVIPQKNIGSAPDPERMNLNVPGWSERDLLWAEPLSGKSSRNHKRRNLSSRRLDAEFGFKGLAYLLMKLGIVILGLITCIAIKGGARATIYRARKSLHRKGEVLTDL